MIPDKGHDPAFGRRQEEKGFGGIEQGRQFSEIAGFTEIMLQ